ncbi:PepSY domain-containing protein [Streptomyces sp. NBC_00096]|uniref:PepSY domain-containing protein n=1 Tax=Streptomyces sp. NBC_00096 TaxID=2975650 RepID=UPI003255DF16
MKRTLYVSSAAAAAVLLVAGPVAAAAASTAAAATGSAPVSAPLRASVDADGAATAALKDHPGVIKSIGKDGPIWHVNVIGKDGSTTEVRVNVVSGKAAVMDDGQNDDQNDEGNEYAALIAAKVTAQQAMKAALAGRQGSQVYSVEWDDDDNAKNVAYWNVEIKSNGRTTNVHVDPTSGKATVSHDNDKNDDNG